MWRAHTSEFSSIAYERESEISPGSEIATKPFRYEAKTPLDVVQEIEVDKPKEH